MVRTTIGKNIIPPELQEDAYFLIPNPVSGLEIELLPETPYCRILSAYMYVVWDTNQPTPMELHFDIDGQRITHTQANPVTATAYYAERVANETPILQGFALADHPERHVLYEGRLIQAFMEITWPLGNTTAIAGRIKYATWP